MADRDHQCGTCGRTFTRNEHLERHRRVHTREKPFKCPTCPQRFSRSDQCRRHCNVHEVDDSSGARKRQRTRVACDVCNSRKLRCDDERPCQRCLDNNTECSVSQERLAQRAYLEDGETQFPREDITPPVDVASMPSPFFDNAALDMNLYFLPDARGLRTFADEIQQTPYSLDLDIMLDSFLESEIRATLDSETEMLSGPWHQDLTTSHHYHLNLPRDAGSDVSAPANAISQDQSASQCLLPLSPSNPFSRLRSFADTNISGPPSPSLETEREMYITELEKAAMQNPIIDDRRILSEFLWQFDQHISGCIPCFKDRPMLFTRNTRRELYLTMAAVGGLICPTPGSTAIAKSLYNYARLLLMTFVYSSEFSGSPIQDQISSVETFILMEVFGYMAGDRRAYELIEVMHSGLIQIYSNIELAATRRKENDVLTPRKEVIWETLALLDCYRVILLQRPPMLPIFCRSTPPRTVFADPDNKAGDITYRALTSLATPGCEVPNLSVQEQTRCLYCLIILTWSEVPTVVLQGKTSPQPQSSKFMLLALHNWATQYAAGVNPETMIMFHLAHLNLFVCIPAMQDHITQFMWDKGNGGTTGVSASSFTQQLGRMSSICKDETRPAAGWHAQQIISLAQKLGGTDSSVDSPRYCQADGLSVTSGFHVAYAVSTAILTLWCLRMHSAEVEGVQDAQRWLKIGRQLLSSGRWRSGYIGEFLALIFTEMLL